VEKEISFCTVEVRLGTVENGDVGGKKEEIEKRQSDP
jgi:hypothetical protein